MPKKIIAFLDELDKEEVLDCAKEHNMGDEIIFCDTCKDFEKAIEDNPEGMMVFSGRLAINGQYDKIRKVMNKYPSVLFRKYGFNSGEYIHKKDRELKSLEPEEFKNLIADSYYIMDVFNEFYNNLRLEVWGDYIRLEPEERVIGKSLCWGHGDEGPPIDKSGGALSQEEIEELIKERPTK